MHRLFLSIGYQKVTLLIVIFVVEIDKDLSHNTLQLLKRGMNVRKVDSVQLNDRGHPLGKWIGVLQEERHQRDLMAPKGEDKDWRRIQPEDLHPG